MSKNSFSDGQERDSPYAMRTKLDEIANRGGLEARRGIDSVLKDTFENGPCYGQNVKQSVYLSERSKDYNWKQKR